MKIIAFCPVRKGTGQTSTIINMGMYISGIMKQKTLIIDLNDYSSDIEFYLSRAGCAGGLDEFAGLSGSKLMKPAILKQCCEKVAENLDIMTANKCTKVSRETLKNLLDLCKGCYDNILIDCTSISTEASQTAFREADVICVVACQNRRMIEQIIENVNIKSYRDKLVTIINRCPDRAYERFPENRLEYSIEKIKGTLGKARIKGIMDLPNDIKIVNMMNNDCLQGYIPSFHGVRKGYFKKLEDGFREVILVESRAASSLYKTEHKAGESNLDVQVKSDKEKTGGGFRWRKGRLSVS